MRDIIRYGMRRVRTGVFLSNLVDHLEHLHLSLSLETIAALSLNDRSALLDHSVQSDLEQL